MVGAIVKSAGGPAPTLDPERFCIMPAGGNVATSDRVVAVSGRRIKRTDLSGAVRGDILSDNATAGRAAIRGGTAVMSRARFTRKK
jgi:hypothetical protein